MNMNASNKVLVTGGSGFIGLHLVKRLLNLGFEPVVFSRSAPKIEGVRYILGDMADLTRLVELADYVLIYHLAWSTKPASANQDPIADVMTNVVAGLVMLDALVKLTNPPRLIFVSTGGALYGVPNQLPITETHSTHPINAYGVSKLSFEQYLHVYHHVHGLDYLIFRPGNPYGEGQDPSAAQGAIAVFLGKMRHSQPIDIWGDGTVTRDYLYIDDVINALVAAINYFPGREAYRVFNVGSGYGASLNHILQLASEITGITPDVRYLPARKIDAPTIVLDITQIKQQLKWTPQVSLVEGLHKTWGWMGHLS
jgi:UDP-glucose 4-epimerase